MRERRTSGSRQPHRHDARRNAGDGIVTLYGWHTVKAALENPQRHIRKLVGTENAIRRLDDEHVKLPVKPDLVRPDQLVHRLGGEAVHQGLFAEADPLPAPDITELPGQGVVLVLDQVTDPHNVGAIMRSAAAFAVEAIVTTARHSPEATGVLAKAASGALEYVPLVTVTNLARGLTQLQDAGYFTVGLDSDGAEDISALALSAPLAIVLGAEGSGLRRLTRETCDVVARLPLPGRIKSLNVSNAAALALYVATTRVALKA